LAYYTQAQVCIVHSPVPSPRTLALGQQLRAYREHAQMSREEASHRSGVSMRTLGRIETGRAADIGISTLEALCALYGVELRIDLVLRRLR
jgi:transcriptional regulator with XRE-family HTH domain